MDTDNNIYDINASDDFLSREEAAIIKVIGVGGGGGNAVNYMFRQNIPHVNFVVCNTDKTALNMSPVPHHLLLGPNVTKGRGAGNDPAVGRECAEESADDIRMLFEDQTEMVFITAGMGGGTGTGAAPVVARLAREAGMLTIGIVTVPFRFEGEKKILKAIEGAKEMKKHVDSLLMINNQNLIELYKDLNFFNAFGKADDTLANAARSIAEIISEEMYINVDFEDVKTTLRDSGTAIISTAYGEGEHRISDAIHNALHSPLLKHHDIYTSKRLLFKFSCWKDSPNALSMGEIDEITQFTTNLPSSIDVKWGVADDPSMGDKVKMTVLASGFDMTISEEASSGPIIMESGQKEEPSISQTDKKTQEQEIEKVYGKDTVAKWRREQNKVKYAVLTPGQFDDHDVIRRLEETPTYNRDVRFNESLSSGRDTRQRPSAPQPRHDNDLDSQSDIISFDEA
ncbi:MAG: cell division protein FtsZ [Muribaculaceae bacterium]|nr:cell division protein FtsZ [Muribaculaceae bacterium]